MRFVLETTGSAARLHPRAAISTITAFVTLVVSPAMPAARAQMTGADRAAPVVILRFEGEWPDVLRRDVERAFSGEARLRGLTVIATTAEDELPAETDRPTLATVSLTAPSVAAPSSTVTIRDRLTRKLIERVVVLGSEPLDVWSVVIAAAADELLRASWVELGVRGAPTPAFEPPEVVRAAVADSFDPPTPGDGAWGAGLDIELVASDGAFLVGGRLGLEQASLDPVLVGLAVGVLGLLPASSDRARFEGAWFVGDLEARLSLVPRRGALRLSLVAMLRTGALVVSAQAAEGLLGRSDAAATVLALGGLRCGVLASRGVLVTLGLLVGAPLLGVAASDGVRDVAAIAGPTVAADLGVGLWP